MMDKIEVITQFGLSIYPSNMLQHINGPGIQNTDCRAAKPRHIICHILPQPPPHRQSHQDVSVNAVLPKLALWWKFIDKHECPDDLGEAAFMDNHQITDVVGYTLIVDIIANFDND